MKTGMVRADRPVLGVAILWVCLIVGFGVFTPGQALSSARVSQLYLRTLELGAEFAKLSLSITKDRGKEGEVPLRYVLPLMEIVEKASALENDIRGEIERVQEDLRSFPGSALREREFYELAILYRVVALIMQSAYAYIRAVRGEADAPLWVEVATLYRDLASTALDILNFSR